MFTRLVVSGNNKLAVWYTGHAICDTVAKSLARGLNADVYHVSQLTDDIILRYDGHIAYGILRGTADVFKAATRLGRPYWIVDKGYWGAGHFTGTYRISHQGTQCRWTGERVRLAVGGHALIVPPTPDVCKFFNIDLTKWLTWAVKRAPSHTVRFKTNETPIHWQGVDYVLTFNSSLGWQALERGIPCVSDAQHSVVGSYFIDGTPDDVYGGCEPLFEFMRNNQMTLREIEQGKIWSLIERHCQYG